MSYHNHNNRNLRGRDASSSYSSSNREGTLEYSGSDRSPYTQGGYTQYTGAYTERGGGTLDYSDRTPYTQGGYTTGGYTQGGYTTGGYTQGGYTTGGYTQGGYTVNDSGRSSYSKSSRTSSGYPSQSRASGDPYHTNNVNNNMGQGSVRGRDDLHSVSQLSSQSQPQQHVNQHSQQHYYGSNSSVCASTGGTTVADGGQGRCPYQIDFQVQNQGKQISASKRIIHFRFGFADSRALSLGKTGMECRGEEHDIVVTWSITGGKRAMSMDGREIQYSAGKRAGPSRRADVLEASWRMSDHVYELSCYAYKPSAGSPEKRDPRWKQYSLIIDGRSFFELPQIFDLGLKGLTIINNTPLQSVHSHDRSSSQISGLSSSFRSSQSKEAKNDIQARIAEQRRLLNARKQAVSNENRKNRSKPKGSTPSVAEETLNSGMESMGLESGIHSAAPSELDEAKNRKEPAPVPPPIPTTQCQIRAQQSLGQQNVGVGMVLRSNDLSGPPQPKPHQIQQQQNETTHMNYQHQHTRENHHTHQAPIQAQQTYNQMNAYVRQEQLQNVRSNISPQQPQIQAQETRNQPGSHTRHEQTQNVPPMQQNSTHQQRMQHSIMFDPQQPPTYEEITRDVLGACDGSSVADSSAVESSIVPRMGAAMGHSELDSSIASSSIVLKSRGALDSSDVDSVSNVGSIVSRTSTYVSKATFVPAKLTNVQKPGQKGQQAHQPHQTQPASSVDPRGINKWGYF